MSFNEKKSFFSRTLRCFKFYLVAKHYNCPKTYDKVHVESGVYILHDKGLIRSMSLFI